VKTSDDTLRRIVFQQPGRQCNMVRHAEQQREADNDANLTRQWNRPALLCVEKFPNEITHKEKEQKRQVTHHCRE